MSTRELALFLISVLVVACWQVRRGRIKAAWPFTMIFCFGFAVSACFGAWVLAAVCLLTAVSICLTEGA